MKKMSRNLDGTHFVPTLNLISHTWSFYKMFDIAWCDKYDFSVMCLLCSISSLILCDYGAVYMRKIIPPR